jgi:endonuclease/exonuclease/phosphatase family metal-dependent hydrolase
MPQLKVATFNVEWMISLFVEKQPKLRATFPGKQLGPIRLAPIADVPGLANRIAGVIRDINPDILGIQEGPPLKSQLERFVADYLNGDYVVLTSNSKNQTVHALIRQPLANGVRQLAPGDPEMARLTGTFSYYPWQGFRKEDRKRHRFDRVPLVFEQALPGGTAVTFIVVHTKSKISKLKTKKQWEDRNPTAVLSALDSRQKLSAEVAQLRRFVDERLAKAGPDAPLIVLGDFNDGPFRDVMEEEFLLHGIVDELVGTVLEPDKHLWHAMKPDLLRTAGTTRFQDPLNEGKIVVELIDHILVSAGIRTQQAGLALMDGSCVVERAAFDKYDDDQHNDDRGLRPSDHVPVSAVFAH